MDKSVVDILWIVVASTLVFIMQAGFAMVESGLTRSKNSINVAIKNLTDLGVSTIFYWISGFALMFGLSLKGFSGTSRFLFSSENTWEAVFFVFQVMFCSTSATIVSGAVAERMKFSSYILSTILLSVIVYPIFGHWVWGGALSGDVTGWLGVRGFVDFAGSTVVHSLGGWVSLALLIILGPRTGKYGPEGKSRTINGSNIPIAVLGVILLWFGWFGFNGGSTLAMNDRVAPILLNTTLSAAAGMVGALAIGWPILKKPDIGLVLNGALAGLVAITAPCHAVNELDSVLIGLVSGVVMFGASNLLDYYRIDDAVGAIPVHLAAGIWGTLAVALFGDPELLGTGLTFIEQLKVQALGVVSCGIWAFGLSFLVMFLINKFIPLRVNLQHEQEGLNKAEHGVTTEIHDLFFVLEEQSRTGDITLRAPVEPFTEVGQIAGMYNNVMDKLSDNTVEKEEYFHILDNVSDGMMLLDENGAIGPYFSSVLKDILESKDLAGKRLESVLEPSLAPDSLKLYIEFFDLVKEPDIAWRNVEKVNPLKEVELSFDDGTGGFKQKYLSFFFKRVVKDKKIDRIMVIIRDITHQKLLAEEIKTSKKKNQVEMELFYQILHVEPSMLREFLDSVNRDLLLINDHFKQSDGSMKDRLSDVFRYTHSIKGDSQLLNLEFITEEAQKLENEVSILMKKETIIGEDFVSITLIYSKLKQVVDKLTEVSGKWMSFNHGLKGMEKLDDNFLESSLESMAERLAHRYGKKVNLDFSDFDSSILTTDYRKTVKDILVQLLRNSIYHGIESPELRDKWGKNQEGRIKISLFKRNGKIILDFRDDGKGLDAGILRNKSVAKGFLSEEVALGLTDAQAYKLIFRQGLSTAESVDTVAGRGVGMPLVYSLVKEKKGSIGISVKEGKYCCFSFNFSDLKDSA